MTNVLTLIAPLTGGLSGAMVDQGRDDLEKLTGSRGSIEWLSAGEACDILFSNAQPEVFEAAVRESLGDEKIDLYAQPIAGRRKKLLISDMDSTVVTSETLDEMAEFAGLKDKISAITKRAMNGELDFAEALYERVKMLSGLDMGCLEGTLAGLEITPGAKELVATMSGNGAYTALVSGGFEFFTSRIGEKLGFDFNRGNDLEVIEGKLTGRVPGTIVTKETKVEVLNKLAAERGISAADAVAVGDGANDLPMLKIAGLGVAYHAKPSVVAEARAKINHCDLSALLFLQGYKRDEFF